MRLAPGTPAQYRGVDDAWADYYQRAHGFRSKTAGLATRATDTQW